MNTADESFTLRMELILGAIREMEMLAADSGDFRSRAKLLLRALLGTATVSRGMVFRYLAASGVLQPHVSSNCTLPKSAPRMPDELVSAWLQTGAPVLFGDLTNPAGAWAVRESDLFPCGDSRVLFPMIAQAHFVGIVVLGPKFMNTQFTREDMNTISLLLRPLTMAYFSNELLRTSRQTLFQLRRKVLELETLGEVGRSIISLREAEHLQFEILMRASSILDASHGALLLRAAADAPLEISAVFGFEQEGDEPVNFKDFLKSVQQGVTERSQVLAGGIHRDERILAVPIFAEERNLGLLCVANKETRTGHIPFSTEDENLLVSFASLVAVALENAQLHLAALEKERIEKEIDVAARIQRGLLPAELPSIPGYLSQAFTQPCRTIGGDFYDCIELGSGRFAFVIADVAGKSIPAALLVSTLHAALHTLRDELVNPSLVSTRLNEVICQSASEAKYITMVLLVLDANNHRLQALNAGHNPPFILGPGDSIQPIPAGGIPFGLFHGMHYEIFETDFHPGMSIVAYTDGVVETRTPSGEEFGTDRLIRFFGQADGCSSVLPSRILRHLSEFRQSSAQEDDITFLRIQRLLIENN